MLIIYLKIIYLLFFSTKQNFVHDLLKTTQCRVLDLRIWKSDWLLPHVPLPWRETQGLCTIYKQTRMHLPWIWYFCQCLFWIRSIIENLRSVSVLRLHTQKVVGSRHLCFESQHSYYGFHVACKVLCICFDQSLFGMPSHIKMLGIHVLGTNNPRKALFQKHDLLVEQVGIFLDIVITIFSNVKTTFENPYLGAILQL